MNRDKMLEAMMKAVTDAVVDVNVEEILAKVYPQIDEKIHETYGFLPEVHEVRKLWVWIFISPTPLRRNTN